MYNRLSGRPTESLERYIEDIIFGGYMKPGTYKVTLTDLMWTDEYLDLLFMSPQGETSKHRVFIRNASNGDYSYLYKQLIASAAEDVQDLWKLHDNPETCIQLLDKHFIIVLEDNGGVKYQVTPSGYKGGGITCATLTELKDRLKEKQQVLSYTILKEIHRANTSEEGTTDTERRDRTRDAQPRTPRPLPSHLVF